jgi:uncharacterized protein with HEPN domain
MPRSLPTYLADIQLSIGAIEEFTNGRTLEQFEQDRMLRSAVRGELMIVGEAVNQLLRRFPETETRIRTARRIVDFRNLLIHEYGEVDDKVVWSIVIGSMPSLKEDIEAWLETFPKDT